MSGMLNPEHEKLEALVESLGGWNALASPEFELSEPIIARFATVGVPEKYIHIIVQAKNTNPRDHAMRNAATGFLTLWRRQHQYISRSKKRRSWRGVLEEYWRCNASLMAKYQYTMEEIKDLMIADQCKFPGALEAWCADICDELLELDGNIKNPGYLANIETRLQSAFRPTPDMTSNRRAVILMTVNGNGKTEIIEVEESTGSKELDLCALSAIEVAFRTHEQPPCNRLSLRVTFFNTSVRCRPAHT